MWFVLIKAFKYIVISALVLTWVKVGPGGDSVQALLDVLVEQFVQIEWSKVAASALENGKEVLESLIEHIEDTPELKTQIAEVVDVSSKIEDEATSK